MSYIEQSLGANETVHYTAKFPTARYLSAWLVLGIGLVGGAFCALHGAFPIGLLIIACAAAAFFWIMYRPWTTEIAITNLRLIYKRGLFQRRTNDLQLRAIEEVRLHQDFWGRMFDYGNVEFHGTGVDDLRLPALRDPVAVQKAVQEALGANQNAAELPGKMSYAVFNCTPERWQLVFRH
jgi:uncharacterized membrane protein YdbT with pleckstrin-like domain